MKEECTAERCKRITAVQTKLEFLLASTRIIPRTRVHRESWLNRNAAEFRRRMRKCEACERRRDFNIRLDKRPHMPSPVERIQSQAARHDAKTGWGKLLRWRIGWYGVERASAVGPNVVRLFFVVRHRSDTHVLGLDGFRAVGDHYYLCNVQINVASSLYMILRMCSPMMQ